MNARGIPTVEYQVLHLLYCQGEYPWLGYPQSWRAWGGVPWVGALWLGYPPPPSWPGRGGPLAGVTPPSREVWTDRNLWKNYLTVVLRTRSVKTLSLPFVIHLLWRDQEKFPIKCRGQPEAQFKFQTHHYRFHSIVSLQSTDVRSCFKDCSNFCECTFNYQ